MAGELSLDRQIEWAEAAVADGRQEVQRILDELSSNVQIVSRRFTATGEVRGSGPLTLSGNVNQLSRWCALLDERRSRLRALRSWREET